MKRLSCVLAVLVLTQFFGQEGEMAAAESAGRPDFDALRLAVRDLMETFDGRYPNGSQYLQRLETLERQSRKIGNADDGEDADALVAAKFAELQRKALLANPLLDFDKLLLIKRKPLGDARREKGEGKGLGKFLGLPQQSSWQQDEIPNVDTWENEVVVMSDLRGDPEMRVLFKPSTSRLVGDLELHYDAQKIAFSISSVSVCMIRLLEHPFGRLHAVQRKIETHLVATGSSIVDSLPVVVAVDRLVQQHELAIDVLI